MHIFDMGDFFLGAGVGMFVHMLWAYGPHIFITPCSIEQRMSDQLKALRTSFFVGQLTGLVIGFFCLLACKKLLS